MSTISIILAGFGGQGILFAGKFLAYKGLVEDKKLSWLPSYGPEMRGGTANCSVILSDEDIGSPIVSTPDCLMAMNLPSLDKFEASVAKGGKIFVDSTLGAIGIDAHPTDGVAEGLESQLLEQLDILRIQMIKVSTHIGKASTVVMMLQIGVSQNMVVLVGSLSAFKGGTLDLECRRSGTPDKIFRTIV